MHKKTLLINSLNLNDFQNISRSSNIGIQDPATYCENKLELCFFFHTTIQQIDNNYRPGHYMILNLTRF